MILVDSQIQTRMDSLFDLYKSDGVSAEDLLKQINPNSIDLTISKNFKRPRALKNPVVYGFSCLEERELYNLTYWGDYEAENGYIEIKPNDIILGATREYVTMPDDMCGQLYTKSTMGRMFINHMMAGVIDAGFQGVLTLELRNDGVHTVRIPVGSRVVQMVCYGLTIFPDRNYGDSTRKSRYMNARTVECAKWSKT